MNIVDSSAWLEYFAESKNAKNFTAAIENTKKLLVPVIVLYEVFKKILKGRGESLALQMIAQMKQGKVIDIDLELALTAAKLSSDLKLPMADSLILATAQKYNATIWTQDADFMGIANTRYFKK